MTTFADLADRRGASYVGYTQNNSATVPLRTVEAKLRDYVDLTDFAPAGATPYDGVTVWDDALDAALSTGRSIHVPSGSYIIKRPHYINNAAQRIIGEGVGLTTFRVTADFTTGTIPANFSTATVGVFSITNPNGQSQGSVDESRAGLENFSISFQQPDNITRANVIKYPWAISATVTRPYIGDIIITSAYNGILTDGRCGGLIGKTWEVGAYGIGWSTDGAYDTKTVERMRFWPYGCNSNVYFDGATVAAQIGADDGIQIGHLFTIGAKVKTVTGTKLSGGTANGPFSLTIDTLHLDSANDAFEHTAGNVQVGQGYISSSDQSKYAVKVDIKDTINSGSFIWNGLFILCYPGPAAGVGIIQTSAANAGTCKIGNAFVRGSQAPSTPIFSCAGGQLDLNGIHFDQGTNVTKTAAFISQTGGRILMDNIRFPPIGSGTGNCVSVSTNDTHMIQLSNTNGWNVALPSSLSAGSYDITKMFLISPSLSFQNPGSSSFTYGSRVARYAINNNRVFYDIDMTATCNSVSGASGVLILSTGIPYSPTADAGVIFSRIERLNWSGIASAQYSSSGYILFLSNSSGSPAPYFGTGSVTVGSQFRIQLSGSFAL